MDYMTYPIILEYSKTDKVYYVEIKDFKLENGITYGKTIEEALKNAKDVLVMYIREYLDEKKELPKPTDFFKLEKKKKENQVVVTLNIWLPYELSLIKIAYKKKTLSIPTWLDALAMQKNLNFSQILQKALKEELNIGN